MSRLEWDTTGDRLYETGISKCVLYPRNSSGLYPTGYAWNGISSVSENPEGADSNKIYADNIKYLDLRSVEELNLAIEAYMFPDQFMECDGTAELAAGVYGGQQTRKYFGLCYRTEIGNDTDGDDHGYKLHLVYGCTASPAEKGYSTINDSPEAISFSWDVTTTPIEVAGKKPMSLITIDSTKVTDATKLARLEAKLYGVSAEAFDASKTYAVGDYVTHAESTTSKTYVCKTAITTPAAWDASKWTEVANDGPQLPLPAEVISMMS